MADRFFRFKEAHHEAGIHTQHPHHSSAGHFQHPARPTRQQFHICLPGMPGLGRMSEIIRLKWDDVDLARKFVTLYTRKKKGGHLTPRKISMTQRLSDILSRRFVKRDLSMQHVFCHKYWSQKEGNLITGPFIDRKRIMKTLCKKAFLKRFNKSLTQILTRRRSQPWPIS